MILLCLLAAVAVLTYMLWITENAVAAAEAKTDEVREALRRANNKMVSLTIEANLDKSALESANEEIKKAKKRPKKKIAGRQAKP